MNKLSMLLFTGTLSALMLMGCEREPRVEAGPEEQRQDTYEPVPAQPGGAAGGQAATGSDMMTEEARGELVTVNATAGTITVRSEDGQMQTYRIGPQTTVTGPEATMGREGITGAAALAGKEGMTVAVRWAREGEERIARVVEVTEEQLENMGKPGGGRTY